MSRNIWEILEIEKTTDKIAIKKAYAKKCKQTHPEDHPEAFMELYEAYKLAMKGEEEYDEYSFSLQPDLQDTKKYENPPLHLNEENGNKSIFYDEENIDYDTIRLLEIEQYFEKLVNSNTIKGRYTDLFWEEMLSSAIFEKYKKDTLFIEKLTSHVLYNDLIATKYLKIIADKLDVFSISPIEISEDLYPLYLYLNDRIHGFLKYTHVLNVHLLLLTILSSILFFCRNDLLVFIFLISLIYTIRNLLIKVPKFKNQETSSTNIYDTIAFTYLGSAFFLVVQFGMCILQFPQFNLIHMALQVFTLCLFIRGVLKKVVTPLQTTVSYEWIFLLLILCNRFFGDREQAVLTASFSFILILVSITKEMYFSIKTHASSFDFVVFAKHIGACLYLLLIQLLGIAFIF